MGRIVHGRERLQYHRAAQLDLRLHVRRPVLQGLTVLNILYAIGIAILLGASVVMPGWPERALGFDIVSKYPQVPVGLRAIIVVGLLGAAIVHTVLRRLVAIVDTVRDGDPFILRNARHLDAIAWSVFALEVLRQVATLPPDHDDVRTMKRAASYMYKLIKKQRRAEIRQERLQHDLDIIARTATGSPMRIDDETAGIPN